MSPDGSGYFARLSQCVGKEPFSTPQLAKKVQRRRARKRRTYKAKQHVYHCRHCGLFHIGTPAKSRQDTTSGRWRFVATDMGDDESMA